MSHAGWPGSNSSHSHIESWNNGDFTSIYTSQEGGGVGVTVPVVGQECGSLCVDSKLLPQFYTATTNSRKAGKYHPTMSPKGEPEILRYQH